MEEMAAVHKDIEKKGEETLQYLKETAAGASFWLVVLTILTLRFITVSRI